MHGDPILLFMIQVVVVLALARTLGEVFRWLKQPPLAGEIMAGLLLGQTVLGYLAPDLFASLFPADELQDAMFRVMAELGIMFMLLVVGLEVNVSLGVEVFPGVEVGRNRFNCLNIYSASSLSGSNARASFHSIRLPP